MLERSEIGDYFVKLPEQLDRKSYEEVNKILVTAGGKWNRAAKAHVFTRNPREVLGLALESGEITDEKKLRQAYYTPDDLARRLVDLYLRKHLHGAPERRVLEPSCGAGAFVQAILDTNLSLKLDIFDIDAQALEQAKARVAPIPYTAEINIAKQQDFLEIGEGLLEDRYWAIVMNLPFTNNQWAKHLLHAWNFLAPGGRLLAILPSSAKGAHNSATKMVKEVGTLIWKYTTMPGVVEDLPKGTFKESGADVQTVVVVLQKP